MQPRWKRVVTTIDGQIGEALGKLYVKQHFPPAAKKRMDELVSNLMAAYRERLAVRANGWARRQRSSRSRNWIPCFPRSATRASGATIPI